MDMDYIQHVGEILSDVIDALDRVDDVTGRKMFDISKIDELDMRLIRAKVSDIKTLINSIEINLTK